jgi:hypothetical protein
MKARRRAPAGRRRPRSRNRIASMPAPRAEVEDTSMSDRVAMLPGERPWWRRLLGHVITVAIVVALVLVGRWGYREWKVSGLAPRLQKAPAEKPDDEAVGTLLTLRCASAREALWNHADGSALRCYLPEKHLYMWVTPRKTDGTQLLMYYRLPPGSADAILPWNVVWKGNGVSYRNVELTKLSLAGEKLTAEFKLADTLPAILGLSADEVHRAEFKPEEFVKLVDTCELDVRKAPLTHPDLGWPANLLKRAGALTPKVYDKLRKK